MRIFKRDYLNVDPISDAATVLAQIDGWFEDDNENHPHSGLGMRLPGEFIRARTATAKVSGQPGATTTLRQCCCRSSWSRFNEVERLELHKPLISRNSFRVGLSDWTIQCHRNMLGRY